MQPPRHLSITAWLALLLVVSLVSGQPAHAGSVGPDGDGRYSSLDLAKPPDTVTNPSECANDINDASNPISYGLPSFLLKPLTLLKSSSLLNSSLLNPSSLLKYPLPSPSSLVNSFSVLKSSVLKPSSVLKLPSLLSLPSPSRLSFLTPGLPSLPSRLSVLTPGLSEPTSRVALTRQTFLYTLCEAKPPLIYSRVTFAAYKALIHIRARSCTSYYRARRLSLPPAGTPTEGERIQPTRTQTTSPSNPAEPSPAHRRTGGKNGYKSKTTPAFTSTPAELQAAVTILFSSIAIAFLMGIMRFCRLRCIGRPEQANGRCGALVIYRPPFPSGTLCRPARLSPPNSQVVLAPQGSGHARATFGGACIPRPCGRPSRLIGRAWISATTRPRALLMDIHTEMAHPDQPFEPSMKRVAHLAYELTITAYRFQMERLCYQKQWEHSGLYDERTVMEQSAWSDIERMLRGFETEFAEEPFLGVEMSLKCRMVVFDVYEDQDGASSVEVPVENDGVGMFANQIQFKFDPDPTSAYIEELEDTLLDQAWSGEVQARY